MIFQSGVSWRIDVYPTYAKANEVLGPSDKLYLVHMRNLGYYLDRRWGRTLFSSDTPSKRSLPARRRRGTSPRSSGGVA